MRGQYKLPIDSIVNSESFLKANYSPSATDHVARASQLGPHYINSCSKTRSKKTVQTRN